VPCALVECDATRRYAFADFERFAVFSPEKKKREDIAAIRLPKAKLTQARANKLSDQINRCAVAEKGTRSQVDFALC
jgi:hypothetical protein